MTRSNEKNITVSSIKIFIKNFWLPWYTARAAAFQGIAPMPTWESSREVMEQLTPLLAYFFMGTLPTRVEGGRLGSHRERGSSSPCLKTTESLRSTNSQNAEPEAGSAVGYGIHSVGARGRFCSQVQ